MIKETIVAHEQHCFTHPLKRICWSAIFVGALVGIGLGFLFNLFGVAIGLSAVMISPEGNMAWAIGGVIGILIALIVTTMASGFAAGYLGRMYCPRRNLGILYGFTTWTMALLLSAVVAGYITHYASHYSETIMKTPIVVTHSNGAHTTTVNPKTDTQQATEPVVTSTQGLTAGAFVLFGLFFIGAISSCVGACWAMSCRRDD